MGFAALAEAVRQNRWWIFQQQRFPILKYGVLIGVFSMAALNYSAWMRGQSSWPWTNGIVAYISVFCFFWQLRIADEFKDYEEDLLYRPDRPLPSGLISFAELRNLGIASVVVQVIAALWLTPNLLPLLVSIWCYFGLMSYEFFAPTWLKARPIVYMATHLVSLPLIGLYATACDWLLYQSLPSVELGWFLLACLFNGIVIEVGRKIRAPEDEEMGVNTYSFLWGRMMAARVWLTAMGITAIMAALAAELIQVLMPVAGILGIVWAIALRVSRQFLENPSQRSAKLIDNLAGIWTLVLFFSLGILPLFIRRF